LKHTLIVRGVEPENAIKHVFCLLEIAEPPQAKPITVQTAKPWAIIDPSPRQNAIAKSVKRQLAYKDARRSAKYRDPGSAPSLARIVEALTLRQIWSAGCTRAITKASQESGAGWRLVQCDSPQKYKYFSEQPSKQPFAREKENRLLGRFVNRSFY
jgi:hypothetical protein